MTDVDLDALSQYCSEHRLSRQTAALLQHLVDESALVPGLIDPFETTTCATEFALGTRSGRRTLVRWIRELAKVGAVRYTPRQGKTPGRIEILVYDDLTLGRDGARLGRDLGRDGARLGRDGARSKARAKERTKEEDLNLGISREGGGSPKNIGEGKDWTDDELEELLGELIRQCAKASPPIAGLSYRAGLLAALAPYSRRQVRRAATVMSARLRGGEDIRSPFGMLHRKAKQGAAEYFTVPAPPAVCVTASTAEVPPEPVDLGPFMSVPADWDK